MIKIQPSITADRLPELIQSSLKFWMKSPDVIMGLLWDEEEGKFVYWKWNEKTMKGRLTSALKDKKCFKGINKKKTLRIDHKAIISYKPESRIVWKCEEDDVVCCKKLYKPDSFDHRAASSTILSSAAPGDFPKLLKIDRKTRSVAWEWIDGKPPETELDLKLALDAIKRIHACNRRGDNIAELTDGHIFVEIKTRINSLMAWVCVLDEDSRRRIANVAEVWDRIVEQFLNLKPSEELTLLHGDFRPRNILIDASSQPRIIDADHAAVGHREWDYAAWVADMLNDFEAQWEPFIESLIEGEALDKNRLLAYVDVWRVLIGIKAIEEKES